MTFQTFTYQQLPPSSSAGNKRTGAVVISPKFGKEVMILGGARGNSPSADTFFYTFNTNTWRRGPNIPPSSQTLTVKHNFNNKQSIQKLNLLFFLSPMLSPMERD